jgi:uncharacterized membrane protein
MDSFKKLFLILGIFGLLPSQHLPGQTPEPVVHAVLFYSPTCPHCHQVITEHLIPLQNQYGSRLVILGMDTSQPWASNLYWEAIRHFKVPEVDWNVPFLLVGEEIMVGGIRIPDRFPTLIEEGLAAGGIDLPNYPALVTFLQEQEALDPRYPDRLIARQTPAPEDEQPPTPGDSVVADEPVPAGDTAAVEDSAVAGVPAVTGDAAVAEDTVVGSPEDTTEAVPSDAAGEIQEPEATPVEPGAGVVDPAPEEVQDTAPPEPAPDPAVSRIPDSPELETRDSPVESLGTLGLAEAAREMESMTMWDRFNMDRTGNSLSVLVLLGMVVSLVLRGFPPRVRGGEWPAWVIPTLALVGAGVAAYLSFIEVTGTEAVCGPVGDCNTVNQSEYALLFGVLPVGVLGLVGYGLILVSWVLRHAGSGGTLRLATLGMWGAALLGTLFSVYLTFLEPFVIGATCAWCLTSAVVITLLLWAASPMAARVWSTDAAASSSD